MKSSAAFALGLWTGAAVVAAVSAFYWHGWKPRMSASSPRLESEWQAKDEELRRLRQEQARCWAEEQRLRQTNTELKSSLARAMARTEVLSRRVPFRRKETPIGSEQWILDAVATANTNWLPRLVAAALQNNTTALEALAVLADRDGAGSLLQVVNADPLDPLVRARAAQFIASAVETSPQAEEWVRSVFNNSGVENRLLTAAVSGLLAPSPRSLVALNAQVLPASEFQPDYALRLRLLEVLPVREEALRATVAQVREELQRRAATTP